MSSFTLNCNISPVIINVKVQKNMVIKEISTSIQVLNLGVKKQLSQELLKKEVELQNLY